MSRYCHTFLRFYHYLNTGYRPYHRLNFNEAITDCVKDGRERIENTHQGADPKAREGTSWLSVTLLLGANTSILC